MKPYSFLILFLSGFMISIFAGSNTSSPITDYQIKCPTLEDLKGIEADTRGSDFNGVHSCCGNQRGISCFWLEGAPISEETQPLSRIQLMESTIAGRLLECVYPVGTENTEDKDENTADVEDRNTHNPDDAKEHPQPISEKFSVFFLKMNPPAACELINEAGLRTSKCEGENIKECYLKCKAPLISSK